jgi:hypothetical protein
MSAGQKIGKMLLFSSHLEADSRTPYVTFSIPPFITDLLVKERKKATLDVILPSLEFWIALTVVSLLIC